MVRVLLYFAVDKYPPGSVFGGDVQIWRRDISHFTAIEAYETIFAYRFKLYIEKHSFSGTGNLVVRRTDFEAVGPFAGINVAEDIEWGRRVRAARRKLICRRHDCFPSCARAPFTNSLSNGIGIFSMRPTSRTEVLMEGAMGCPRLRSPCLYHCRRAESHIRCRLVRPREPY